MRTYPRASELLQKADLDFDTADLRVIAVMTNTSCGTEDALTISGFTQLDEYDGTGSSREALVNAVVQRDDANRRAELDADDTVFSSMDAGSRDIAGLLLYAHVTNDADSIPIAFLDGGSFPFSPNGGDMTVVWDAEGIFHSRSN